MNTAKVIQQIMRTLITPADQMTVEIDRDDRLRLSMTRQGVTVYAFVGVENAAHMAPSIRLHVAVCLNDAMQEMRARLTRTIKVERAKRAEFN